MDPPEERPPSEHARSQKSKGHQHEGEGDSLTCDRAQSHPDRDRDDRDDDAVRNGGARSSQEHDHYEPGGQESKGKWPRSRSDARQVDPVVVDGSSNQNEDHDHQNVKEQADAGHLIER